MYTKFRRMYSVNDLKVKDIEKVVFIRNSTPNAFRLLLFGIVAFSGVVNHCNDASQPAKGSCPLFVAIDKR